MVNGPLLTDIADIQAAISECLGDGDLPVFGHPVVPLQGNVDYRWFEARLRPHGNRHAILAREFFYAAAEQGVGHRIELRVAAQALRWLENAAEVDRLTISISQFSLLVPGALDRLLALISHTHCAPGAICVSVTSMDDIDYASHLHSVAWEVSRLGALVMLDRLDDVQSEARKGSITHCDFFRLGPEQVRLLPGQVAARCAVELLLRRLGGDPPTQVVAVDVSNKDQQEFLRQVGVSFMNEADPKALRCMTLDFAEARTFTACGNG